MFDKNRLESIIANFGKSWVLVVGDIILDHFISGKVSRISPEAPVPIVNVEREVFTLGGSANVLANIAAVGGKALGTGIIGADASGERVLQEFSRRDISPKGLITEVNRRTTIKSRIIGNHQQIARLDYEDLHMPTSESCQTALAYIESVASSIGALIISDYGKGFVCQELLDGIRKIIAGRNIFVCVDPKKSDFDFYAGFDIVTPNTLEALAAAGVSSRDGCDIVAIGESLLQHHDIAALLITRSEEGMSLFERTAGKGIHTHFPTQAKEVFDVTGAGDTVISLLALAKAAGASLQEAVVLANLAAGIVVAKRGTATLDIEELRAVL